MKTLIKFCVKREHSKEAWSQRKNSFFSFWNGFATKYLTEKFFHFNAHFKSQTRYSNISKECMNGIITLISSFLIHKVHLKHNLYYLETSLYASRTLLNYSQILNKMYTVDLMPRWKESVILFKKIYKLNKEIQACFWFVGASDNDYGCIWNFILNSEILRSLHF